MSTITDCRNPRWYDAGHTSVLCEVCLNGVVQWIPYHAMPTDPSAQGRALYAAIQAGQYGTIGPYVPPPPHLAVESGPRVIG